MKLLDCCIMCYRNLDYFPLPTQNGNDECVTATFVRLFQRLVKDFSLESTHIKVRNKALTILSRNGTNNEPIKFQACATCSEMLSLFNSSYEDLKCAEMKANWSLQQLANILRFADYVPARRAKFKESVTDLEADQLLNDEMIKMISTFRKQLQFQCRLHYKNQFPRVVLMKPTSDRSTDSLMKDQDELQIVPYPPTKSKEALISTALTNLNSLQLILFLALFDPLKANISNTNFGTDGSFGQFSAVITSKEHDDAAKSSLPSHSSPVGIATNGGRVNDDKWAPSDGVTCSTLNAHGADTVVSSDYTTRGHENRFCTEDSLRHHELHCQSTFSFKHKNIVEGSPASSPSPSPVFIADDSMDDDWEPGDDVKCSGFKNYKARKGRSSNANSSVTLRAMFKCDQCNKTFSSLDKRDLHSKQQHDYTESSPPSSPPSRICSTNDTGDKDDEWSPDGVECSRSEPKRHNVHSPKKADSGCIVSLRGRFKCDQCIKTFSSLAKRDSHSKQQHDYTESSPPSSPPSPIDSTTDNGGEDDDSYKSEPHNVHNPRLNLQFPDYNNGGIQNAEDKNRFVGEYPAESCEEPVENCTDYHTQIIKIETTYCCSSCQFEFGSDDELEQHMVTCSKTWHDMDVTNSSRSSNVQIKQELVEVPTQRSLKQTKANLKRSKNKFRCKKCGKRFSLKANLNVHLRTHLGKKRFECSKDNCVKTFSIRKCLQFHFQKCHKNHTIVHSLKN